MYKVILVAVDIAQEELTSKTIRQAVQFAKVSGAKLNFIHVLPISSAIINAYALGYMEIKDRVTLKAEDDMQNLFEPIDLPADHLGYTIARVMKSLVEPKKLTLTLSFLAQEVLISRHIC